MSLEDLKIYDIPNVVIYNVTENSFDVYVQFDEENALTVKPDYYNLEVSTLDYGSKFESINIKRVELPYRVSSKSTGEKFFVFVEAYFSGINDIRTATKVVNCKFVPTESIAVKNDAEKATLYLPASDGAIDRTFSKPNILGFPKNASNTNYGDGGYRYLVNYSLEDTSIADIDGDGYIRAKKRGITKLRMHKNDERDTFPDKYVEIEVKQGVTDIKAENTFLKVKQGESQNLIIDVFPNNANVMDIKYTSDSPQIATVDLNTGLVTGKSIGTATISCVSVDNPTKKVYIIVEVLDSTKPVWTDIKEIGDMINSTDFNALQGNIEYIYTELFNRGLITEVLQFPRVTNTSGYKTVRTAVDALFGNVFKISNLGLAGFIPMEDIVSEYNNAELAPNNEQWNRLLSKLKELKALIDRIDVVKIITCTDGIPTIGGKELSVRG